MGKRRSNFPRWLITVTPFSKMLALAMFVVFPIIAFYFGRYYEKSQVETHACERTVNVMNY